MNLAAALQTLGEGNRTESFEVFSASLNIDWLGQVLASTGSASIRRRKLPAESAIWLVIGMALLRDRSIDEVVHHLALVCPTSGARNTLSHAAIVKARDRLGVEPLAVLFSETARRWATDAADALRWRGLAVYGVDGTSMLVPDTEENDLVFGRPRNARSEAAYPQIRLVALMVLRAHLLADLVPGSYSTGEQTLARPLWERLPERSVVVLDKGFINYAVFHSIQSQPDRHWLCRRAAFVKSTVLRPLGPGDELVEIKIRPELRRTAQLPESIQVRAIHYQRRGFRPEVLLTSLLDPQAYPAEEIVELYHERWEIELGFDEIKTHTLERAETLRSKAPQRVLQEIWGLGVAYNLVRHEMLRVANRLGLPPCRLSFRHSFMFIQNFLIGAWFASPGVLPARLEHLHEAIALLVLPKRRPRTYKRELKITTSAFPKKPPPNRGTSPRWLK